jgi:hypothetical protein
MQIRKEPQVFVTFLPLHSFKYLTRFSYMLLKALAQQKGLSIGIS